MTISIYTIVLLSVILFGLFYSLHKENNELFEEVKKSNEENLVLSLKDKFLNLNQLTVKDLLELKAKADRTGKKIDFIAGERGTIKVEVRG